MSWWRRDAWVWVPREEIWEPRVLMQMGAAEVGGDALMGILVGENKEDPGQTTATPTQAEKGKLQQAPSPADALWCLVSRKTNPPLLALVGSSPLSSPVRPYPFLPLPILFSICCAGLPAWRIVFLSSRISKRPEGKAPSRSGLRSFTQEGPANPWACLFKDRALKDPLLEPPLK